MYSLYVQGWHTARSNPDTQPCPLPWQLNTIARSRLSTCYYSKANYLMAIAVKDSKYLQEVFNEHL